MDLQDKLRDLNEEIYELNYYCVNRDKCKANTECCTQSIDIEPETADTESLFNVECPTCVFTHLREHEPSSADSLNNLEAPVFTSSPINVKECQPPPAEEGDDLSTEKNDDVDMQQKLKYLEKFDSELAIIRQTVEDDCVLFFKLGKEIDKLLQDAMNKEMKITHQDNLIKFLYSTVESYHYNLKKMYDLAQNYKSNESDSEIRRNKSEINDLKQESVVLKQAVFVANRQIEDLERKSINSSCECDDYRLKHRQSLELASTLENKFEKEKGRFDAKEKEYNDNISKLNSKCFEECKQKIENYAELHDELQGIKKDYRNSVDQVIALNAENRAQNEKISQLQQALIPHQVSSEDCSECSICCKQSDNVIDCQTRISDLETMVEKSQTERKIEREKHNQEIVNLKQTIMELEKALRNSHSRSENLQKTVDFCQNSINVLEASEERSKIEISQQRQTIINLQEALVSSKQQLEEVQQKSSGEINNHIDYINHLHTVQSLLEVQCYSYNNKSNNLNGLVNHIRDINVDLEVENFGFIQDVAILETRLLKYQQICKSLEECTCGLKKDVVRLQAENQHLTSINEHIKEQLIEIALELRSSQNCSLETEHGDDQNVLRRVNNELQNQLEMLQQKLISEAKINQVNAELIEELQQMLAKRTLEINQYDQEVQNAQNKLELTLCCNKELKKELSQLINEIKDLEETSVKSTERSEYCQKEIENCRDNLAQLREKLLTMKDLLCKKCESNSKLEADCKSHCNTINCLRQQLEGCKAQCEEDINAYKQTVYDLSEKLEKNEVNYQRLQEDYAKSQAQIMESSEKQLKLEEENLKYEREIESKLQVLKREELRLSNCLSQFETECNCLRNELMKKDHQINLSQEEILTLKNEINKMYQVTSKLEKENKILSSQIEQLQAAASINEQKIKNKSSQVDQCVCEIKKLQDEKMTVENKSKNYKNELNLLEIQYQELDRTYQQLNESVIALQLEVLDHKMCRDEICVESRNVICNVRAWLREQALINQQLTKKLRDDESIIDKLKEHNEYLHSKCLNEKCQRENESSKTVPKKTVKGNQLWNSSTPGSGSPDSADSKNMDWYVVEEYNEEQFLDDDETCLINNCLKKVESINEELQRSNRYWQSKLSESDHVVTRDH